jgi:hypothetical protein
MLRGDDDCPAFSVGVDNGRGDPEDDPDDAANQGKQDGLGQELDPDLSFGGAQRPAQPDLLTAFQHRDDHDVRHVDRADEQRDRAQAEEEGIEGHARPAVRPSALSHVMRGTGFAHRSQPRDGGI